jgi:uncharacterized protein YpmB
MEKVQVIIIILLLIAVVSSVISISMNLSLKDVKPVQANAVAGNPNGGISLVIEKTPNSSGEVK